VSRLRPHLGAANVLLHDIRAGAARVWSRRRKSARIALCLPAAVALAACGAAHEDASRAASLGPYRPITTAEFNVIANGGIAPQEEQFLYAAQQDFVKRCMQAHGFKYYIGEPPAPLAALADTYLDTPTGQPPPEAQNLAARAQYGYGFYYAHTTSPVARNGGVGVEEQEKYLHSLSHAESVRWSVAMGEYSRVVTLQVGDGRVVQFTTGGCHGRAQTLVYGSPRAAELVIAVPETIASTLLTAVTAAPSVVRTTAAWSRCIDKTVGRVFATPAAMSQWVGDQYSGGATLTLRSLEIRYAVADGRCQYSSGLAQAYSATYRTLANHLPASEAGALLAVTADAQAAAARAKQLVLRPSS